MQTRSGKTLCPPPKPQQTVKEVRIPSKKRQAPASSCPQQHDTAPPSKKQKPAKAVHFERHDDRVHGLPRYKGPFPDDSLILEQEDCPSSQLFREMNLELEGFLAEPPSSPSGEVVEPSSPAKPPEQDETTPSPDATEDQPFAKSIHNTKAIPFPPPTHSNHANEEETDHHIHKTTTPFPLPPPTSTTPKQAYLNLKTTAWAFTTTYFPPPPSPSPSLNLEHLCHTSPHLFEYANYISALPSSPSAYAPTWESLFTTHRPFLIYCILGKMLDVHVFGAEMVGATEEEEGFLRKADEEGVMDDGFHRQTHRALDISAFLGGNPLHPAPSTTLPSQIIPTLSLLQASFLEMLSPLLPFPAAHTPAKLQQHLSRILLSAATLSLSIRREPSTIYHWHTHPAPGTLYSSQSMHILDRDSVKVGDFWRQATDVRVVTMAGWPSCVAYDKAKGSDDDDDDGKDVGRGVRVVGRAEVLVAWGPPVEPLAVQPTNWLGPSLRADLTERLERRDQEERMAVAGSGVAVGAGLAMGWVFQQRWFVGALKSFAGL